MKKLPQALVVGLALTLLPLPGCGEGDAGGRDVTLDAAKARVAALEGDTEGVETTLAAYFSAFDHQDAEGVGSLFTPAAEIYFQDGRVLKIDEFVAILPQIWGGWSNLSTTYHVRGETIQRSYGWAKVIADLSYQRADGARTVQLLTTFAVEKHQEKWLISHLQISAIKPPL
jgi:hypothetical protein